jgi:hypothetical protein
VCPCTQLIPHEISTTLRRQIMSGKKKTKVVDKKSNDVNAPNLFRVLFLGRKEFQNLNRVSLNSSDMDEFNIRAGTLVLLESLELGIKFLCLAWPSSQTLHRNISLNRFWFPNFPTSAEKAVSVCCDLSRFYCIFATIHGITKR